MHRHSRDRGEERERDRRWSRSPSEGRECMMHRQVGHWVMEVDAIDRFSGRFRQQYEHFYKPASLI